MRSPLNPAPAGGLRLPAGKQVGILTHFQAKVNKKRERARGKTQDARGGKRLISDEEGLIIVSERGKGKNAGKNWKTEGFFGLEKRVGGV